MLTKDDKRQLYERAWELTDEIIRLLTPLHREDNLSDVMDQLEAAKSKIEERASVVHEFDPN